MIKYCVLAYSYDITDMSTEFQRVVFVTNNLDVALNYRDKNNDKYLGYDNWMKIKIVEVEEK